MFKEIFNMSLKNITSNKMRSALSILGILIGIASIIALLTIGQGVSTSVSEELSGLGGNYVTVSINNSSTKKNFTNEDMEDLSKIPDVVGVSPSLGGYVTAVTYSEISAKTGGSSLPYVYVSGKSHYFFESQDPGYVIVGTGIRDFDVQNNSAVCVLGSSVAQSLFANKNPIGEEIMLNNCAFTIVGVLSKQPTSGVDNQVLVPYTTAMNTSVFNIGAVRKLEIMVNEADNVEPVCNNATNLLMTMFNGNSSYFSVVNQQAIMDIVVTISDLIIGMLGGIAAISLLVGGIGIMNMMLVSVRERTSEIGLRKALGAKPWHVMLQFMFEAIMISFVGGVVGVGVGIAIAYFATTMIGAAFELQASTVLLAAGFSIAVGLIFGIMPARKASRLNPIDALRSS